MAASTRAVKRGGARVNEGVRASDSWVGGRLTWYALAPACPGLSGGVCGRVERGVFVLECSTGGSGQHTAGTKSAVV